VAAPMLDGRSSRDRIGVAFLAASWPSPTPSATATLPEHPAMQPVILDTDVASLLHRRKLTGPPTTRLIGRDPLIIFVTFGELTKWAEIRHWGPRRRHELAS
jgi:hypothetical protein